MDIILIEIVVTVLLFIANALFIFGLYVSFLDNNILDFVPRWYMKKTAQLINWKTKGKRNQLFRSREIPFESLVIQSAEEIKGLMKEDYYNEYIDLFPLLVSMIKDDNRLVLNAAKLRGEEEYQKAEKEIITETLPNMIPFYVADLKKYERIRAKITKPLFSCVFCMPSIYGLAFLIGVSFYFSGLFPPVASLFSLVWIVCLCGLNYYLSLKLNIK